MDVAILIYPRFTALDAVGPYEVLSRLPTPASRSSPSSPASNAPTPDSSASSPMAAWRTCPDPTWWSYPAVPDNRP